MTPHFFSPELQQLVEKELATGGYASEDELLLHAVRLLADRNRRRDELRSELQAGRDQLDRGDGIALDSDRALGDFLDAIEAEVKGEPIAAKSRP